MYPQYFLVMNSWCSWTIPSKGSVSPGRWVFQKKGHSLLLEFGFRPHSSEGLSWQCWCSGSLAYMAYMLLSLAYIGLFVLPRLSLSIMISMYMLVLEMCFIWYSGLLRAWVIFFFFFFPTKWSFKDIFECILWSLFSWCLWRTLSFGCTDWRGLCVPLCHSPWLHGRECRTWCGRRWGCRAPGAQGTGERTAEGK